MVVLFLTQNIEITKFFFIKTALLKSEIITIFVKLLHKLFVSWKKVRWSTPLNSGGPEKRDHIDSPDWFVWFGQF